MKLKDVQDFLLGTPQKLLRTIIVLIVLWAVCNPEKVENFFIRLTNIAINTILPFVIVIAIIVYVFKKFIK